MKKLIQLLGEAKDVERKAEKEIVKKFPIGVIIHFEKGGHWRKAEVISHSSSRLKVRNITSLKEYWIDVSYYALLEGRLRRVS